MVTIAPEKTIKPPLKWAGGKRWLVSHVAPIWQRHAARRYVEPYGFATIYVRLGEKEQAMQWLEKAYLERSMFMTRLARDPGFDSLRAEPRFQDLMRRLGAPSGRQELHAE